MGTPGSNRGPAGPGAARTGPRPSSRTRSSIRKDLDRHGHEAGAATIAAHLERRHGQRPGGLHHLADPHRPRLRHPQPHKRPKSSYVRFEAAQPNERWQTDITHWPLADGSDAEICNWLDDHSRFCLASTAARVLSVITRSIRSMPWAAK